MAMADVVFCRHNNMHMYEASLPAFYAATDDKFHGVQRY